MCIPLGRLRAVVVGLWWGGKNRTRGPSLPGQKGRRVCAYVSAMCAINSQHGFFTSIPPPLMEISARHALRRRSGRRRGGGAAAIIVDHRACLLAVCNIKPLRIHPVTASRAIPINTPQFRIIDARGDARSLHGTAWPVRCGPSLLPHAVLACLGREITQPAT